MLRLKYVVAKYSDHENCRIYIGEILSCTIKICISMYIHMDIFFYQDGTLWQCAAGRVLKVSCCGRVCAVFVL